jgi:hypothetical protein
MTDRIETAQREAVGAREKALACSDFRLKVEWLKAARMWDKFACEFRHFQKWRECV